MWIIGLPETHAGHIENGLAAKMSTPPGARRGPFPSDQSPLGAASLMVSLLATSGNSLQGSVEGLRQL